MALQQAPDEREMKWGSRRRFEGEDDEKGDEEDGGSFHHTWIPCMTSKRAVEKTQTVLPLLQQYGVFSRLFSFI
ncbi:hypothetical protein K3495_g15081 [Podosphaera aphanis]|nr:hypothetical protein K3495_g15081 [Podosphaera aphanis]